MEKGIDIHNYDKLLVSTMRRMKASNISERNKKIIEKFGDFCFASGIGKARVVKYTQTLKQLALWLKKDFDKATKQDIEKVVISIQQRSDYSEWTKKDFNVTLKKFYKWLKGKGEFPPEVKWISIRVNRSKVKLPGQDGLLTEDDIKKLIESTDHPRNKALISLLYESGCRVGEIASLQVNNVAFDEKGAVLTVLGKTGARRIRIVSSVSHLLTWINSHPMKDNPKSPLWTNIGAVNNRKHMQYGTIRTFLEKLFKRAGIKKRFNPHIFRHSRATFLANFLTEAQLKVYFGWVQGSDIAGTYVHLSGRDTDHKILEINGMAEENKKKEQELKPKICPRCNSLNSYNSNYCSKCASILDTETAVKEQEKMMEEEKRGDKLKLNENELAFYDAIVMNDSAVKVLGDETLKTIARELVETIKRNVTIDWTVRESVQARLRVMVKKILKKYGYPPDKQQKATEIVLEQANLIAKDWAEINGKHKESFDQYIYQKLPAAAVAEKIEKYDKSK